jgi:hypothetical protein
MAFEIVDGNLGSIPTMATGQNDFNDEVVLGADVLFMLEEILLLRTCFLGWTPARGGHE